MAQLYREIAQKEECLRNQYGGGMMSFKDVGAELGFSVHSVRSIQKAIEELGIPAIKIGRNQPKYETHLVAKAIVERRGMC